MLLHGMRGGPCCGGGDGGGGAGAGAEGAGSGEFLLDVQGVLFLLATILRAVIVALFAIVDDLVSLPLAGSLDVDDSDGA